MCRAKIGKMYAESTPVVDSEYTQRERERPEVDSESILWSDGHTVSSGV